MKTLPSRNRNSGYVLLMTLALLVMAATLLVTVGREAVSRSLAASLAQDQLQRKWGTITCRSAILPHAEEILEQLELQTHLAASDAEATIHLSNQEFHLTVCDEQAKANLNSMLMDRTISDTENRLRDSLSGTGLINSIHLRPLDDDSIATTDGSLPRMIRTFGQLGSAVAPEQLSGLNGVSPAQSITLWGSGAINLMRAKPAALRLALWPTLSGVELDRLLTARNQLVALDPSGKRAAAIPPAPGKAAQSGAVGYLFSTAQIDPKAAARLTVTDRSTCHSMWIIVKDRQRVWYNFAVSDDSISQHPRRDEFIW